MLAPQFASYFAEKRRRFSINDRRGLGLGLFISKWIVEAHKGRIWVESKVGKGSSFLFTLPMTTKH
jgi:signal transduction histidine kinase